MISPHDERRGCANGSAVEEPATFLDASRHDIVHLVLGRMRLGHHQCGGRVKL
jgi:hypothetical protein